ncbi:MAG TPA: hypothetical protein VD978_01655 [Azospirillum sp.]|nr:hypothetical protein [Azospirillum sp.]
MKIDEYLGFRIGDVVPDLLERTAGTAKIKNFHVGPDECIGLTVIAVMGNGAERLVTQLKKVRTAGGGDGDASPL